MEQTQAKPELTLDQRRQAGEECDEHECDQGKRPAVPGHDADEDQHERHIQHHARRGTG